MLCAGPGRLEEGGSQFGGRAVRGTELSRGRPRERGGALLRCDWPSRHPEDGGCPLALEVA